MKTLTRRTVVGLMLAWVFAGVAIGQGLVVTPGGEDGVYELGEAARWSVEWRGDGEVERVRYVIQNGGMAELTSGAISLADGKGELSYESDEPGTLLVRFTAEGVEGRGGRGLGGAAIAPEKIEPSAERPADFDAFWESKLEMLAAVPMDAKLEKGDAGRSGVEYSKITMGNINGSLIRGQLAKPAGGEKLPALLVVQWAGVYPLQKGWAVDRAAEGWLTLNIMAHDLPIDEPQAFYQEQSRGDLRDYPAIGNESRDTSYFLRMYLSCYRAAEYLTQRDDWNGETLVVMGTSQGGLQAVMTAGFHPAITGAIANVPAGMDMWGPTVGRSPGWPNWYWSVQGKDAEAVREASRYYDVVNFASRIDCPVMIAVGLIDETCPPAGVFAAFNQISSEKEIVVMPISGHQDRNGSQRPFGDRAYGAWLPALREGRAAPVK